MTSRSRAALLVCVVATLPYVWTLGDYFVQDDFGVVSLLAGKPALSFFSWFTRTWMDNIWGFTPDEVRPFPAVSYQIAALFGAGVPFANHVINIAAQQGPTRHRQLHALSKCSQLLRRIAFVIK